MKLLRIRYHLVLLFRIYSKLVTVPLEKGGDALIKVNFELTLSSDFIHSEKLSFRLFNLLSIGRLWLCLRRRLRHQNVLN